MYKVHDIKNNKVYEPDFTQIKRLPSRNETIVIEENTFLVINFSTVFPKEESPYLVIMVKPVDKNFKLT